MLSFNRSLIVIIIYSMHLNMVSIGNYSNHFSVVSFNSISNCFLRKIFLFNRIFHQIRFDIHHRSISISTKLDSKTVYWVVDKIFVPWLFSRSILLFRALVLSSIGQLFVLPLLIWSPDQRDYYGLLMCFIFTILCHAQALHGKISLSFSSLSMQINFSFHS